MIYLISVPLTYIISLKDRHKNVNNNNVKSNVKFYNKSWIRYQTWLMMTSRMNIYIDFIICIQHKAQSHTRRTACAPKMLFFYQHVLFRWAFVACSLVSALDQRNGMTSSLLAACVRQFLCMLKHVSRTWCMNAHIRRTPDTRRARWTPWWIVRKWYPE